MSLKVVGYATSCYSLLSYREKMRCTFEGVLFESNFHRFSLKLMNVTHCNVASNLVVTRVILTVAHSDITSCS